MKNTGRFISAAGLLLLTACSTGKHTQLPETVATSRVVLEENYEGFCHLDGVVDNTYPGYQASGYALVDSLAGSKLSWAVTIEKAGDYILQWRYASGKEQPTASLEVNHQQHLPIRFPATGALDHWQNATVKVSLEAGLTSIALLAESDLGLPLIDSLSISGSDVRRVNCDGTQVATYQPNPRCLAGSTFSNETVDCGGARIGLACEGGEFMPPVISLENAHVKNLRIAAGGGSDGIWCTRGDCVIENVVWEDICEDAATQKSQPGSTLTVIGGWSWDKSGGKIFQHNAPDTTFIVTGGFTMKGRNAKMLRACGNCDDNGGNKKLIIDDVRIEGVLTEEVVAPNVNYGDKARVRNLQVKNYQPGQQQICAEWVGFEKAEKKPAERQGEAWNTAACDLSPSDVTAF